MSKRAKKQASRLLKVSALSLRVGGSYLKQKAKEIFSDAEKMMPERMETHVRNAKRVAETIGQMKGTVMKFGQMLSLNTEFLPEEVTRVLSSLQKEAPPVAFAEIEKQLVKEFSAPVSRFFADFDERPFAAASIGQVHRARTKAGKDVVVKVQYPDVDEDVEGDLENLQILFYSFKAIKPNLDLSHIMKEMRELLLEELDYRNEAKNVGIFRECFAKAPLIKIPEPILELTTKRVLTLEYLSEMSLSEFSEKEPSGTKRNRVGEQMMRFYLSQLFQHGMLHGDPNPGNFGVGENQELIVYDFGCVKFFPKTFIQAYRRLIRDFLDGKIDNMQANFERLGFKQLDEKKYAPEFFEAYGKIFLEPYLQEPYSFAEADLQEKALALARTQLADLMNFRPPRHVVFHDRVLVGAYNNMRALKATGYWRTILEEVFALQA